VDLNICKFVDPREAYECRVDLFRFLSVRGVIIFNIICGIPKVFREPVLKGREWYFGEEGSATMANFRKQLFSMRLLHKKIIFFWRFAPFPKRLEKIVEPLWLQV
jgi:hypothetical protein